MEVECKRIFGPDGHFNVSVTTHLFESQPTTHISQFTITSEILTNEVTTKTLGEDSIIPQVKHTIVREEGKGRGVGEVRGDGGGVGWGR